MFQSGLEDAANSPKPKVGRILGPQSSKLSPRAPRPPTNRHQLEVWRAFYRLCLPPADLDFLHHYLLKICEWAAACRPSIRICRMNAPIRRTCAYMGPYIISGPSQCSAVISEQPHPYTLQQSPSGLGPLGRHPHAPMYGHIWPARGILLAHRPHLTPLTTQHPLAHHPLASCGLTGQPTRASTLLPHASSQAGRIFVEGEVPQLTAIGTRLQRCSGTIL